MDRDVAYFPMDMPSVPFSMEVSPVACMQRCASTFGCAHFSFWLQQGHCHLQDGTAQQDPALGFTSGPAICSAAEAPVGQGATVQVPAEPKAACFETGGAYFPLDLLGSLPFSAGTAEECQQACQKQPNCAHFSWYAPTSTCHAADLAASHAGNFAGYVAGPARCDGIAEGVEAKFAEVRHGIFGTGLGTALASGPFFALALLALLAAGATLGVAARQSRGHQWAARGMPSLRALPLASLINPQGRGRVAGLRASDDDDHDAASSPLMTSLGYTGVPDDV